ncbi:MAG: hypothetical protein Q9183_006121, partial [Haloplaca sp. 2 TL-2023]
MNVTARMQPSVMISGETSGGNPVDGKYDLTITSTPPCALPIYQNCSARSFDASADQWEAYEAGSFLEKYMKDNEINSLSTLFSKATTDFLPTGDAQGYICNPDAGTTYECGFPSPSLCDSTEKEQVAGFLIVAAVTRMSQMLQLVYSALNSAQVDM